MHNFLSDQKGLAAIEAAMLMPVVALLFFVAVEGTRTINAYATISEASRSAARHIVLSGEPSTATSMVHALVKELPPASVKVDVALNDVNDSVTVEVSHSYTPLFPHSILFTADDSAKNPDKIFTLRARTTMPMP